MKTQSIEIPIRGMDCAECAQHVHAAICKVEHVQDVQVFLGAEKARVYFVEGKRPDLDAIKALVAHAGYQAEIQENSHTKANQGSVPDAEALKRQTLSRIVIFGLVFAAALGGELSGFFEILSESIPVPIWLVLILTLGFSLFRNVVRSLLQGRVIAHALMTLGVIASTLVGEWVTALIIVIFMRVGSSIEELTASKTRQAIHRLTKMMPAQARLNQNGEERLVPVSELKTGNHILLRPGDMLPVDGLVREGFASLDQTAISGESLPREVAPGAEVFAASLLQSGSLIVEVRAVGVDSTFGKILQMVEEAELHKGKTQMLADRFSGYFLPVVIAMAGLTYLVRGDLIASAAVLVVACSCSFALATPIAMLASIGSSASMGLLIKGGKHIEMLERVDTICIDKTGTLTLGKPVIVDILPLGDFKEDDLLQITASAERYSEHPLAQAVLQAARSRNLNLLVVEDFRHEAGVGINASVAGKKVRVSNQTGRLSAQLQVRVKKLQNEGKSTLFVTINRHLAGILTAADTPRQESLEAIRQLKEMGLERITLLSGDNAGAVRTVADFLDIESRAGMLPHEKIAFIKQLQEEGRTVAMIGDGINDAPALAQADVGIAMGEHGSQLAVESAGIVLLREDWLLVPKAFAIARRTMRVVKGNILFTLLYNFFGIGLAALGVLPPVMAAAMQSIPDFGILGNSARLLKNNESIK